MLAPQDSCFFIVLLLGEVHGVGVHHGVEPQHLIVSQKRLLLVMRSLVKIDHSAIATDYRCHNLGHRYLRLHCVRNLEVASACLLHPRFIALVSHPEVSLRLSLSHSNHCFSSY